MSAHAHMRKYVRMEIQNTMQRRNVRKRSQHAPKLLAIRIQMIAGLIYSPSHIGRRGRNSIFMVSFLSRFSFSALSLLSYPYIVCTPSYMHYNLRFICGLN